MKIWGAIVLVWAFQSLHAYPSGIAIRTSKSVMVQVYVNGKLYNKVPTNYVHIRSAAGKFQLKVKILNLYDGTSQEITRSILVSKGFEYQFHVIINDCKEPELVQLRRYPVYSRYLLDRSLYLKSATG